MIVLQDPTARQPYCLMQLGFQRRLRENLGPIRRHLNATTIEIQQFDRLLPLSGAKDQPNRRFLIRFALVAIKPVRIQLHLSLIAGLELADLQFDRHQPAEISVEEQKVQIIIHTVHDHPLLPFQKREASAQLQDERLPLPKDSGFQILFCVSVLEAEKIQEIGIAEDQIRCQPVVFPECPEL